MAAKYNDIDLIKGLQDWYLSNCNDDWEHTYGIFIENIDNPGWSLKVQLEDTNLSGVAFPKIQLERELKSDWIFCEVVNDVFQGFGGPENLGELISLFLSWANENV